MEERSLNEKKDSESETTDTTKKRTRQTRKTIYPLPDGRVSTENLIKVIQGLDVASKKGEVSFHITISHLMQVYTKHR